MKEIKEFEKLNWGYGYCWRNYNRNTITTFLVPFNFILRWGRELYFWLAKPKNYIENEAYKKGYTEGRIIGFEYGKKEGKREIVIEFGNSVSKGISGMEEMINKWVKEGYYFTKD